MGSRNPTDQIRLVSNASGPAAASGHVEMTQMTLMSSSAPLPVNHGLAAPNESLTTNLVVVKGGKRKRLSKACDACHKSKRRCDGTAPCSNCYFASKECTYTDSNGRPVPAPRNVHPSLVANPTTDMRAHLNIADASYPSNSHAVGNMPSAASASARGLRRPAESSDLTAKRARPEQLGVHMASAVGPVPSNQFPPGPPVSLLDPGTTHELTNLFFTHCNPARLIIHKPSFCADLAHEQVPPYLVLALCANAAPYSKELGAKATMPRLAGVPFFEEARTVMFDSSFSLRVEPDLYTVQALCLLEMHEVAASHAWTKHYRYFDLALRILEEKLGIDHPDQALPSPPGPNRTYNIEKECARRCFWLIQLMGWINGIYTFKPMRPRSVELMRQVRLPCDETSFELAVATQGPEYMHTPGPRTKYASQFGHLCRVLSMYQTFETALANLEGAQRQAAVLDARRAVTIWANSLPDHLQFTEENLDKQLEMFETSSNTGAWCFCFMHVMHACFILSLVETEKSIHREESIDWVRATLSSIFAAIGHRAKNTILSACALWSYSGYQPDDPQLKKWDDDFEKIWGFRVCVVAAQWREAQAEQRRQLGRTYPVDSISQNDSPPACQVVASDSSSPSPSTSTDSSPREPESQYSFTQNDPKGMLSGASHQVTIAAPDEQIHHARGYPVGSMPIQHERDLRVTVTTSLPSIRTMGILDKSWNPPTDAMQHVSLMSGPTSAVPSSLPSLSNHIPNGYQTRQQDAGATERVPAWPQQPPALQPLMQHGAPPQVGGVRASGGMPTRLEWLNDE